MNKTATFLKYLFASNIANHPSCDDYCSKQFCRGFLEYHVLMAVSLLLPGPVLLNIFLQRMDLVFCVVSHYVLEIFEFPFLNCEHHIFFLPHSFQYCIVRLD